MGEHLHPQTCVMKEQSDALLSSSAISCFDFSSSAYRYTEDQWITHSSMSLLLSYYAGAPPVGGFGGCASGARPLPAPPGARGVKLRGAFPAGVGFDSTSSTAFDVGGAAGAGTAAWALLALVAGCDDSPSISASNSSSSHQRAQAWMHLHLGLHLHLHLHLHL
eukprot:CAMPEP_0202898322 /NCGR_PEP_ID=MMETSP1392-20130828/6881_1 /ASSEMBLY_ACC=CAM_ASM_000868 /TAXON_ID=225041 /ORGANISM="Chlamydomonas chlamydogama, Strain SAG 11-48b" /LENGTH=163 /DNA_ID=CAMNT_0049584219 /DNA_START=233 /DNA_END=722 /DNA_ORIENTATION=+